MTITINTPIDKVWFALTDKEMIEKYFWGTETSTDWKEGSFISFAGIWEDFRKLVFRLCRKALRTSNHAIIPYSKGVWLKIFDRS
jgi:hypothetical protein